MPEALLGCFCLDRPDAERMADLTFAFFAPGNDAGVWRGCWYPEAATAQIAATRASPVEGWWNAAEQISRYPAGPSSSKRTWGPLFVNLSMNQAAFVK